MRDLKTYVRRREERVMVTCWCECEYVWVPVGWIGVRTASCSKPWCHPKDSRRTA